MQDGPDLNQHLERFVRAIQDDDEKALRRLRKEALSLNTPRLNRSIPEVAERDNPMSTVIRQNPLLLRDSFEQEISEKKKIQSARRLWRCWRVCFDWRDWERFYKKRFLRLETIFEEGQSAMPWM